MAQTPVRLFFRSHLGRCRGGMCLCFGWARLLAMMKQFLTLFCSLIPNRTLPCHNNPYIITLLGLQPTKVGGRGGGVRTAGASSLH